MSAVIAIALVALALVSTVSAGLDLQSDDGAADRGAVARLVVVNAAVVPALFWVVAWHWRLVEGAQATALWLVALAPGGASSPLLARSAGGRPATVAWGYLLLAALGPALLWFGFVRTQPSLAAHSARIGVVAGLQVVPLVVAAMVARRARAAATTLAPKLRAMGNALLALVIVLLVIDRGALLASLGARTLVAMVSLAAITAVAGALAGPTRAALSTLTVVRNLTLVLLLSELSGQRPLALIVAAYGLVMYAMAVAITLVARRKNAR